VNLQIGIAMRAADRISVKLEAAKCSGKVIDMEEEFRLLTLQVIGEAVLSLPPEECDRVGPVPSTASPSAVLATSPSMVSLTPSIQALHQACLRYSIGVPMRRGAMHSKGASICMQVFPQLYLPVMAEANLRSIRPWRQYIPTPSFFAFHWRMRQLNSYITQLLRQRWNSRPKRAASAKLDILDRLLNAIEVRLASIPTR